MDTSTASDSLENALLTVLFELRVGEVVSYGDVAEDAGFPGRSRAVGRLLATTGEAVPWWRVTNSVGRLAPGKVADHASRLRAEGVIIRNGRVIHSPLGRFAKLTGNPQPR